jgi:hypothetical protein
MKNQIIASALLTATFLGGCMSPPPANQPAVARFFLETRPGESGVAVQLPQSGTTLEIGPKPVLAEFDIVNAEVVQVDLGRCLLVQLTPAAARDLYRLSAGALGRRLVLTLDDRVLGARRVDQPMADGAVLVFVEVPDEQLPAIVRRIKHTSTQIALAARRDAPH